MVCSSLVSVFTEKPDHVYISHHRRDYGVPHIKLAHFSVKEYLISVDIRNGPAGIYAISRELADTSIAESCLVLLLHFDKPDSLTSQPEEEGALFSQSGEEDSFLGGSDSDKSLHLRFEREFPLAQYAAQNWVEHAHNASGDNDTVGGLVSELFLNRDALENWIRLRGPGTYMGPPNLAKPSNDIGPSIYYASEAGFIEPLKKLIETGADANVPGGRFGNALQAACFQGHQQIVQILLDTGADVNAQGGIFGSALRAASFKGYQKIVQILLDAGADVNARVGRYGSALQAALSQKNQVIARILRDHGAHEDVKSLENDENKEEE